MRQQIARVSAWFSAVFVVFEACAWRAVIRSDGRLAGWLWLRPPLPSHSPSSFPLRPPPNVLSRFQRRSTDDARVTESRDAGQCTQACNSSSSSSGAEAKPCPLGCMHRGSRDSAEDGSSSPLTVICMCGLLYDRSICSSQWRCHSPCANLRCARLASACLHGSSHFALSVHCKDICRH